MASKTVSQKRFSKGVNVATGLLSEQQGTIVRSSNLLLTQRGSLQVCDGSASIGTVSSTYTNMAVIDAFSKNSSGEYPNYVVLSFPGSVLIPDINEEGDRLPIFLRLFLLRFRRIESRWLVLFCHRRIWRVADRGTHEPYLFCNGFAAHFQLDYLSVADCQQCYILQHLLSGECEFVGRHSFVFHDHNKPLCVYRDFSFWNHQSSDR